MTSTRRKDVGLGATAAGGSSGSFATYDRAFAEAPPVVLTDTADTARPWLPGARQHVAPASTLDSPAAERQWNEARARFNGYCDGRIRSVVNWVDHSIAEDGAVRASDWRYAMFTARSGDQKQQPGLTDYPAIRAFIDRGVTQPELRKQCADFAAHAKRTKADSDLATLCNRFSKHGTAVHESDIPAAHRADALNTEVAAGNGMTDEQMARAQQLSNDTLADAVHGELSNNERANLLTLVDTLEDQNFHAECTEFEAIVAIDTARKQPEKQLDGREVWALAAASVDVPDDVWERAERDQPGAARSGKEYAAHARTPFL